VRAAAAEGLGALLRHGVADARSILDTLANDPRDEVRQAARRGGQAGS
jgi:hypothetical protein